jgi:hypothetical protein
MRLITFVIIGAILCGFIETSFSQNPKNDLAKENLRGMVKTVKYQDKTSKSFNKAGNYTTIISYQGIYKHTKTFEYNPEGKLEFTIKKDTTGRVLETEEYMYGDMGKYISYTRALWPNEPENRIEYKSGSWLNADYLIVKYYEENTHNIDVKAIDYIYDEHGNILSEDMTGIVNGLRKSEKNYYKNSYYSDGKLMEVAQNHETTTLGREISTDKRDDYYTFLYDTKGNKAIEIITTPAHSLSTLSVPKSTDSTYYDIYGNIKRTNKQVYYSHEITTYKYVYDAKGNWTKKTKYNGKGVLESTETRTISYFQ